MKYLEALAIAFFCATLWKRARWSRKRKRGEIPPGTFRTGAAIGNALQVLEEFVHPHTKHMLQERLKEQEDQDEDSETADPAKHLLRQARRIQRGEPVENITALWHRPDDQS